MKPADYKGNPTQSTPFETARIGLAKSREGQLMLLNVLSSTLYSDKILACWREYGCNAADANIEAGKSDVPIKIVLPTSISPTAVIRDYGTGISKEDMFGRFLWMGESTKRESNSVTGMLGIGRMSGLAYGDSFLVVSYTKGMKRTYNIYRDQGVPNMAMMHEDPTDEPDGLEIKIPVRREDIHTFCERAERTFRYFKVKPEVKGGTINWLTGEPQFKGTGWGITGSGGSVAVMGNVGYAIDKYSLNLGGNLGEILEHGAILYFDIGELEITANREGLQYKGKTIPAIKAKLKTLSDELAATITKSIASATSYWDAKKAYGAAFEKGGSQSYYGSGLGGLVSNKVTWNNIPITTGRFKILNDLGKDQNPDPEITVTLYDKSNWRRTVRRNPEPEHIYANDNNILVINDLKGPSPARVKQYFVDHPTLTGLAVFSFTDDKAKARYWKAKHLEGAPTLLLSTFPKPPPKIGVSPSSGPYNSKYSAKAFVLNEGHVATNSYYRKEKCSDWWKQEVVKKNDGGVFVIIDQFQVKNIHGWLDLPSSVVEEVKAWRKAGVLTTPLYGFKADKAAKLNSNWVKLEDHIKAAVEATQKWPTAKKDITEYFTAAAYDGFIDAKHYSLFPANSLAALLIMQRKTALSCKHHEIYAVLYAHQNSRFVKFSVTKTGFDYKAFEQKVIKQYPLLGMLPRYHVLESDIKKFQPIVDYINLIENDLLKTKP